MKQLRNDDESVADVLELLRSSDTVELKVTVKDSDQRSALMALDMDVLGAEFRQVFFFDTPDLKLHKSGLIVRARRIPKGGDTVVKLRPVVPSEVPQSLRQSGSFKVELDAMPGSFVCSASLKGKTDNAEVKKVLAAVKTISKLFSKEQRAFYKDHAPKGLDLDRLTPFGPINVAKLKFTPDGYNRPMAAEVWFYPDASRILELSTKCLPAEAFQVAAETRAFLRKRGISVTGEQEAKTVKALHHFSHLHTMRAPSKRAS